MALEILRDPRLERVEWQDLCDLRPLEVAYEVAIYVPWLVASCVFAHLMTHGVMLEGMILKPNMVTPGSQSSQGGSSASREEVAAATVTALRRTCPAAVPGVLFLSGGQSEEDATAHLNAMNDAETVPASVARPWTLSFSYGRALQASVLKAWGGDPANVDAAQKALLERARANGAASLGEL